MLAAAAHRPASPFSVLLTFPRVCSPLPSSPPSPSGDLGHGGGYNLRDPLDGRPAQHRLQAEHGQPQLLPRRHEHAERAAHRGERVPAQHKGARQEAIVHWAHGSLLTRPQAGGRRLLAASSPSHLLLTLPHQLAFSPSRRLSPPPHLLDSSADLLATSPHHLPSPPPLPLLRSL